MPKIKRPFQYQDFDTDPENFSFREFEGSLQPTLATCLGYDGIGFKLLRLSQDGRLKVPVWDFEGVNGSVVSLSNGDGETDLGDVYDLIKIGGSADTSEYIKVEFGVSSGVYFAQTLIFPKAAMYIGTQGFIYYDDVFSVSARYINLTLAGGNCDISFCGYKMSK